MAMRSQVYEWENLVNALSRGRQTGAAGHGSAITANTDLSIFIGGQGNNITKPAETTATQFVVIEDIGVTPSCYLSNGSITAYRGLILASGNEVAGPRAYLQVTINTTDYFLDPDGVGNDGVPGTAAPYPKTTYHQGNFNLYPDIYVLPGQTWDMGVTFYNTAGVTSTIAKGELQAFCKYTLYDGPDALIANKLLEMGVSVNPGNVDWYKRSLLSGQ